MEVAVDMVAAVGEAVVEGMKIHLILFIKLTVTDMNTIHFDFKFSTYFGLVKLKEGVYVCKRNQHLCSIKE